MVNAGVSGPGNGDKSGQLSQQGPQPPFMFAPGPMYDPAATAAAFAHAAQMQAHAHAHAQAFVQAQVDAQVALGAQGTSVALDAVVGLPVITSPRPALELGDSQTVNKDVLDTEDAVGEDVDAEGDEEQVSGSTADESLH